MPSLADEAERLGISAGLTAARKMLARTDAPDYANNLTGTIGAGPISA